MSKIWKRLDQHMQNSGGWEISRRYFVMNGFDGVLTVLGVTLSAFFLNLNDPTIVLGTGFSASIAIGVSGFWIAFLTEEAEQKRNQDHMEKQLFTNLEESMLTSSRKVASFVNSFIDGISPFLFGSLSLIAFLFVQLDVIPMNTAFQFSFATSAFLLFVLGIFLGKISKQNVIIMGIKTMIAGVFVVILIYLTGLE